MEKTSEIKKGYNLLVNKKQQFEYKKTSFANRLIN